MKKRINLIFILLTVCAMLTSNIYAFSYSGKYYTIDIPDIYKEQAEGSFTDSEGNGINIQIQPFTGQANYSQEELDAIANSMEESLTYTSEDTLAQLREFNQQSETPMSEEELVAYATALSYKVDKKEITTFGKENYTCFHFVLKSLSEDNPICMEQYMTNQSNNVIAVTIASASEEGLKRQENIDAINSFTLTNGTQVAKKTSFSFEFLFIGLVCLLIIGAVLVFIIKYIKERKNKKYNQ